MLKRDVSVHSGPYSCVDDTCHELCHMSLVCEKDPL